MRDDNTARACYSGYILKALADIEDDLKNIRGWNRICPILDEESKNLIERIYWVIKEMKKKTNDKVMDRYGILIFPNDIIDREDGVDEYEYLKKKFEEVRRD